MAPHGRGATPYTGCRELQMLLLFQSSVANTVAIRERCQTSIFRSKYNLQRETSDVEPEVEIVANMKTTL